MWTLSFFFLHDLTFSFAPVIITITAKGAKLQFVTVGCNNWLALRTFGLKFYKRTVSKIGCGKLNCSEPWPQPYATHLDAECESDPNDPTSPVLEFTYAIVTKQEQILEARTLTQIK